MIGPASHTPTQTRAHAWTIRVHVIFPAGLEAAILGLHFIGHADEIFRGCDMQQKPSKPEFCCISRFFPRNVSQVSHIMPLLSYNMFERTDLLLYRGLPRNVSQVHRKSASSLEFYLRESTNVMNLGDSTISTYLWDEVILPIKKTTDNCDRTDLNE